LVPFGKYWRRSGLVPESWTGYTRERSPAADGISTPTRERSLADRLAGGEEPVDESMAKNSCSSACIDQGVPPDVDQAEAIVGLAVEDVAGILASLGQANWQAFQVDAPVRIERNLKLPKFCDEPLRFARG